MANGLRAQPTLRSPPGGGGQLQAGSLIEFVDSLPEQRSLIERLQGNNGLNPGDPSGKSQIQTFEQAILKGELDEARVQKLIRRNPLAAATFASALDQRSNPQSRQNILGRNFSPGAPRQAPVSEAPPVGNVPDVVSSQQFAQVAPEISAQEPQANLQRAILEAANAGDLDLVDRLRKSFGQDDGETPFAKVNPKDFTPASVAKFEQTRRPSDLRRAAALKKDKITGSQRLAAGFAVRLEQSGRVIDELGPKFTDAASRFAGILPRELQSTERLKVEQAERNFVNSVLRRESGAAISASEFENAEQQYFPRPGDSEAVISQKRENRITVQKSFELEAEAAFSALKNSLPSVTVKVLGKNIQVGSIVTNSRGQKGRVEQDGSITVLP